MQRNQEKSKRFMTAPAEHLAIKDTLASLRFLIPIVVLLQIFLLFVWVTNITGDRSGSGIYIYLGGYVYMLVSSLVIRHLLNKYATDIPRYREQIYHTEMTYAWSLPVWAAILTLTDAVNASDTFSNQLYIMANMLTMGTCYMDRQKWTLIQVSTGLPMILSAMIMPMSNHFAYVSELTMYVIISAVAGRLVFTMKTKSYERQAKLTEVLDMVEYDSLTGAYTREAFYRKVDELLSEDPDTPYTLVASDIDNFKQINFTFGNAKGNEVLCYLAKQYRKYGKITARYGADQFISIMPAAEKLSVRELENVIVGISEKAPVRNLNIKYGYYDIGTEKVSVSTMCDRALLAAKSLQQDYSQKIAGYDGPVSQNQMRDKKIASEFREAIANKEFVLWYQPKVDPYIGKVVAAEALIRWEKSDGTVLSPAVFMPIFEENGQIIELDEYIFRSVCLQQKRWMEFGKEMIPISVNLSRKTMARPDLVQCYKKIVEKVGVPMGAVPIEITESAAVRSVMIRPIVQEFYENGFTIHMDDFGSGQSSINGLNILHIDVVKIDKSLVDDIGQPSGNTILKGLMSIIKDLGLHIVAEGVEDKAQLDFLMENHVDEIQGYYYSKPLPVDKFEPFVRENVEGRMPL